jgi:hypothetical protein
VAAVPPPGAWSLLPATDLDYLALPFERLEGEGEVLGVPAAYSEAAGLREARLAEWRELGAPEVGAAVAPSAGAVK